MRLTFRGHTACRGVAEGEAVVCRSPFMFLSYVDMETGIVEAEDHELKGRSVKDKVVIYPCGKGSTGEEPSLLLLKEAGVAPKAVVIGNPIYTPGIIGAILADIPTVYGFSRDCLNFIENGDHVKVDADKGIIEVIKRET